MHIQGVIYMLKCRHECNIGNIHEVSSALALSLAAVIRATFVHFSTVSGFFTGDGDGSTSVVLSTVSVASRISSVVISILTRRSQSLSRACRSSVWVDTR